MCKRVFFIIIAAVCTAVFILSISGCTGESVTQPTEKTPALSPAVSSTAEPSRPPISSPETTRTPVVTEPPMPETTETAEPSAPVETPPVTATPELPQDPDDKPEQPDESPAVSEEPKAPERGLSAAEAVTDDYFADAAFFGNSLVDGLRIYGGIKNASFFAATSASVVNVEMTQNAVLENGDKCTLYDALTEKQYGKIYLLLGVNEISFEPDYFVTLYASLISRIQAAEPGAEIYVMSLTPVTREMSGESPLFTKERVEEYNDAIYEMCTENGYHYIDLFYALSDDCGYLPEEEATDGIHLMRGKYPVWADYLRTHWAVSAEETPAAQEIK